MKRKRTNIYIHTRGCFHHTNKLYLAILHSTRQDSKSSVAVIIDAQNQKIENHMIKWEELCFPENWVVDIPKTPKMQSITYAQIKENSSSTILSFPRRSTIPRKNIKKEVEEYKSSQPISSEETIAISSFACTNYVHTKLFELTQFLFSMLVVKCHVVNHWLTYNLLYILAFMKTTTLEWVKHHQTC